MVYVSPAFRFTPPSATVALAKVAFNFNNDPIAMVGGALSSVASVRGTAAIGASLHGLSLFGSYFPFYSNNILLLLNVFHLQSHLGSIEGQYIMRLKNVQGFTPDEVHSGHLPAIDYRNLRKEAMIQRLELNRSNICEGCNLKR
jgi:hypothetical protein